ncbi:hypothetical protein ABIE65_002516 [Constrictibacter sp. MBR-5]|jgi:hypothetical protein|uniref:DUF4340 domain-containing protein n=1 Tax=Constrictibacter sp. MBR-5 TaxID=3156467 RepID=UPI0033950E0D
MRKQSFIMLAAATAVVVIGATAAVVTRDRGTKVAAEGERMFPALFQRANDIDQLVVRSAEGGTISMTRSGERWVVTEKSGYPANFEKVRETLLSLSQMRTVEPRTAKPELLPRLELDDVEAEASKSVRVTAKDGDETVADVLVGRWQDTGQDQGMFVRRAGEDQSWLVKGGNTRPDKRITQWLDRDIVNVDQRRVKSVTITHAGGDSVKVVRPAPGADAFTLASKIPSGREAKAPHELEALASITDFLILDDVRAAKELDFATPAVTLESVTFDGLTLRLEGVEKDGTFWVRVAATESARDPALAAFVEANKGQDSAAGRTADQFKPEAEVKAQVAAIQSKTDGWAYRLTDYKTDKVRTDAQAITAAISADAAKPKN